MSTLGHYKPTPGVPSKELKHYVERQSSMEVRTDGQGQSELPFPHVTTAASAGSSGYHREGPGI